MTIEDPWHSRPLDVHRWSDHPDAIKLSDDLWDEYFADLAESDSRPGPKPKTSYRNQFKVVLLDLWVAWNDDPELSLGVAMGETAWDTGSRYNALHISKKIIPIIKKMDDLGLIDLANGSYGGPHSATNRTTRIRASQKLVDRFGKAHLRPDQVSFHPDRETIILKKGDEDTGKDRPIEYEDTDETVRMRESLKLYNQLLAETFIDIPSLDNPYIEREITSGVRTGQIERISTRPNRTFVRRVFSRGSWNMNGRFYGGWWQQVDGQTRSRIFLNDVPTIEVDYKGMHVAILSNEQGIPIGGDPYELPDFSLPGVPAELIRKLIKQLVLTAINAGSRKSAYSAFRDGWPKDHVGKGMTNEQLEGLLDAFVRKHPQLESKLCSDQGIRLMNLDSQIATRLIDLYTAASIPILCIHDSFIVPYDRAGRLRRAMANATRGVISHPLEVSSDALGLDDTKDWPQGRQLDFIRWRQLVRSPGYLQRMERFEQRTGRTLGTERQGKQEQGEAK